MLCSKDEEHNSTPAGGKKEHGGRQRIIKFNLGQQRGWLFCATELLPHIYTLSKETNLSVLKAPHSTDTTPEAANGTLNRVCFECDSTCACAIRATLGKNQRLRHTIWLILFGDLFWRVTQQSRDEGMKLALGCVERLLRRVSGNPSQQGGDVLCRPNSCSHRVQTSACGCYLPFALRTATVRQSHFIDADRIRQRKCKV